jgi:hypothetical protein
MRYGDRFPSLIYWNKRWAKATTFLLMLPDLQFKSFTIPMYNIYNSDVKLCFLVLNQSYN